MSITVIIAHYAPKVNCEKYLKLLKDNINNIKDQNFDKEVEIIVCDDGSFWSKNLFSKKDNILIKNREQMKEIPVLDNLDIDKYYGLQDINRYRGVILKDQAIRNSSYSKIVILDDDHHLTNKNSINLFSTYLDKYMYVKGRVIGPDHIPQTFFSRNAQGTTYGFQKELYINCGGFSKYLFDNGQGEDNDILYKFYYYLSSNFDKKVSCFAADISTFDLATNRWLDRSLSLNENDKFKLISSKESHIIFEKNFFDEHGVHYKKANISRIRYKWMVFPNFNSILIEFKYMIIYFYFVPKIIMKIMNAKFQ
jgi:hypothetical protein